MHSGCPQQRLCDAVVQLACEASALVVHGNLSGLVGGLDDTGFGRSSLGRLRVGLQPPGDSPHGCDWLAPGVDDGAAHWSGSRPGDALAVRALMDATAEYQQSSILAGAEWIGRAPARAPSEAIGLVVVARTIAVE